MIRNEDGSITLWMVTASFAMMMLVGLAVDLGGQVHAQQRAHNVAGQAARAGGQEVQAAPAVQGRYVAINAAAARNAAQDYLSTAGVNGTVSITDGTTITVKSYTRFKVGEGIEKKADDFAAEVAKMAGQG